MQVIVGFKKYRGQFPSFFIADWAEDRCWRIANRRGGWCWCLIPVAYAHRQRFAALRAEDKQPDLYGRSNTLNCLARGRSLSKFWCKAHEKPRGLSPRFCYRLVRQSRSIFGDGGSRILCRRRIEILLTTMVQEHRQLLC